MNRTRWLAAGAVALALAVGGGVALASGGSDNSDSDFLGDVAKRLGVSQDRLEGAIEGATIDIGPPGKIGPDPLGTAADYLDMSVPDLLDALRDGKSLSDLAKDKDKSVDGLKQALRDAFGKDADQVIDKFVEDSHRDGFEFKVPGADGARLRCADRPRGRRRAAAQAPVTDLVRTPRPACAAAG